MSKIICAVTGSRECTDERLIGQAIEQGIKALKLPKVDLFVFSDSKGVEKIGEQWASSLGYNTVIFPTDWKNIKVAGAVVKSRYNKWTKKDEQYNSNAAHANNQKIVEYATHLIVIDLNMGTSNFMVNAMNKVGKPVYQYKPEGMSDDEFDTYDFWSKLHAAL